MKELNIKFGSAIRDLLWLIEKGYPKNASLQLVGNFYGLARDERMILFRGVFDRRVSVERKRKKIEVFAKFPTKIVVDGFNVLISVQSYLMGKRVFRAIDGYVRDTAGIYGNYTFTDGSIRALKEINRAIEVLAEKSNQTSVVWYLDAPVSRSGELASRIRKIPLGKLPNPEVYVVKNPDYFIINEAANHRDTVIATSDTVIIDKVSRVLDLPELVIVGLHKSKILDLAEIAGLTI